jgi:hypothetical protein
MRDAGGDEVPGSPTVGAPVSRHRAPIDTEGDTSPRTASAAETARVERPHPRPMMQTVATTTKLAGIPRSDSRITIVELSTATTIAAVRGKSVMSFPKVSMVRRAIVSAPTATAADPI